MQFHFRPSLALCVLFGASSLFLNRECINANDKIAIANSGLDIGSKLESFRLTDHLGKEWTLDEFRQNQAVVIAFVGTQCPLAKLYSAKLVDLEKKYRQKKVAFIAVDANVQDSLAEMTAHAKKFGFEFAFLKDPAQSLADRLGVTRTPEVCVLDSEFRIQYRGRIDDQYGIGYTREAATQSELVAALDAVLGSRDIPTPTTVASGCLIGRGPREIGKNSDADQKADGAQVTYAEHVSHILQARCVSCHRPGEIGPMDLSNYDEASAWADMIAEVVDDRRMPPWHASPEHGTFSNDRRMKTDEINTIKKWVRSGAPRGDASKEPKPMQFTEGWQLPRSPDLVVAMRNVPFEIPATGDVRYQYFVADPKLDEDTWVNGMEIIPGNRSVVHHILVFIRQKGSNQRNLDGERGFLVGYVPGTRVAMMPGGMAKRIPAGSELVFQIHYTPNGTAQSDLSKVGFLIADPKTITHEIQTTSAVQTFLRIPPREANYKTSALLPEQLPDCELLSMSPHMHVRGKSFKYTAMYPDGSKEVLMDVPKYDFNWQTEYRLSERKKLPKGTRILCDAVFDNSAENLNNPDPNAQVTWGDQTYEEMMIGYFHISVPVDAKLGRAPEMQKTAAQRPSPSQIFEALDTDRDDKLLKNDIPKQLIPMFDRLDKNKDGVLERSELPK
ncbi:MAG: redoxin domain-containing protein [Pirellula sp.]